MYLQLLLLVGAFQRHSEGRVNCLLASGVQSSPVTEDEPSLSEHLPQFLIMAGSGKGSAPVTCPYTGIRGSRPS